MEGAVHVLPTHICVNSVFRLGGANRGAGGPPRAEAVEHFQGVCRVARRSVRLPLYFFCR